MTKIGFSIRNKEISKYISIRNAFKTIGTLIISIFLIALGIFLLIVSGEIKTLMISGVGLVGLLFALWTLSNKFKKF